MKRVKISALIILVIAGVSAPPVFAGPYVLPGVPLLVSVRSIPNVWFQLDDSGSMDWEVMAKFHYPACRYDSVLRCNESDVPEQGLILDWNGQVNPSGNAEMYAFEYLFDQDDHTYGSDCPYDLTQHEYSYSSSIDNCRVQRGVKVSHRGVEIPYRQDWRARSADLNGMYFNPNSEYKPWADSHTKFDNAAFNAARSWPVPGESGYDVTENLNGFHYNVWIDDKGFKPPFPDPTEDDVTSTKNGIVDGWDSYVRVTMSGSGFTCEKVTHDPKTYAYTNQSNHELRGLDPSVTTLATSDSACEWATAGKSGAQLAQDVANWYQYYRRRTHVMRAAVGLVVGNIPDYRYGVGNINKLDVNHLIPDSEITNYEENGKDLLDVLYGADRTASGTPLRKGLEWVGKYFSGNISGSPSPIIESCQKNFSLLFTDGFWNGGSPSTPSSDIDNDGQSISGSSVLLADVARYYYQTDLRTNMENAVPTDAFDTANWQHLVTYSISFGLTGFLVDTDGGGWPNPPLDVSDDWTRSGNDDLNKVDDMWHAAFNSRGEYFSSERPQDLVDDVAAVVQSIGDRFGGAASAAANSGSISSNSKVFQAKFDTLDWHGELLAFPVGDDGTLAGAALWNADTQLSAKSNSDLSSNLVGRDVFTWNRSSGGTAFEWSAISDEQADLLDMDASGVIDSLGKDRLLYIRGDSSNELKNSGVFRNRNSKLGDIVNSDPVYIGYPPFYYAFDGYYSFFTQHVNRTGIIYFGANDGMFHAIREADGEELFAYVPDKVFPNLSKLTDDKYQHKFYVDGQPEYGDIQFNVDTTPNWKSIVVSGLRAGGQGLFALDVTDPDSFAAEDVLWEFTDEDDPDLGYTYGQPQIKRMSNDQWAVIMSSGINNTEDDGHASTTGAGALFILFIEKGTDGWSTGDFVKITVPGGSVSDPNALFTPAAADVDGDARVDFIYAGDRNGKMWKFDVTSKNTGDWKIAFNSNPLFDAGVGHPITDRPAIASHPLGRHLGQLVLFGTGQFIQYTDNTAKDQPTQTMYAIWDLDSELAKSHTAYGYSRSNLSQGSFAVDTGVRVINSGTDASWLDEDGDPDQRGWYIDLPEAGERIRRRAVLRDDLVFFTTLIPNDDPCLAGGYGWIMVLDTATGLAPLFPVFDIGNDQDVTEDDLVGDDPENLITPVGVRSASIPNLPAFIYDDRPGFTATNGDFPPVPNAQRGCAAGNARAYTFTTQANGSILAMETATESLSCGRQSWRSQ